MRMRQNGAGHQTVVACCVSYAVVRRGDTKRQHKYPESNKSVVASPR